MKPIVHGLNAKYLDTMVFTYLDIDDADNDQWKQALKYRVQPHFVLLDAEGNIVKQWLGFVEEGDFVRAFDEALQ
jgi:thioredoxin-related protein